MPQIAGPLRVRTPRPENVILETACAEVSRQLQVYPLARKSAQGDVGGTGHLVRRLVDKRGCEIVDGCSRLHVRDAAGEAGVAVETGDLEEAERHPIRRLR